MASEQMIQEFWNSHPCGDAQVRGLDRTSRDDYERFFAEYDEFKYTLEDHIPSCLDELDVAGRARAGDRLGRGRRSGTADPASSPGGPASI